MMAEESMENGFQIRKRQLRNANIIQKLRNRETHCSKPNAHYHEMRQFYGNILPNFTLIDVEKPPCFLRKFSPDGRYFVAFSSDQASIEIYEFQGPAAAEDLLKDCTGDVLSAKTPANNRIRELVFNRFFKLKHTVVVSPGVENLNRECSLFTDNSKYVIVGSASYVPTEPHPTFHEVYRNNESVAPNEQRSPLENYTLYLLDLEFGLLCDTRQYKCDKIFLSHNQGLYLYNSTLAILSVQQQTIHILQLQPDAKFMDVRSIGRFCYEDDEFYLSLGKETAAGRKFVESQAGVRPSLPSRTQKVYNETTMNSLKHRLLTHMFNCASKEGAYALCRFYRNFDQFNELRMWKMQLIDETHLLIKYASEDMVTLRIQDPNSQASFFVLYNMVSTEVLGVWENCSEDLLELFENFTDQFRNATTIVDGNVISSAASNIYAKQLQQRFKQTIVNARYGGHTESVKRMLAQLPISAQSFSSSPYLDLSLFSYDDKWVSNMERPKTCGDYPIRFYGRHSNLLKFKIHTGSTVDKSPAALNSRRLVAFTFHPNMPFAISVQRRNSAQYIVNFHIRHVSS